MELPIPYLYCKINITLLLGLFLIAPVFNFGQNKIEDKTVVKGYVFDKETQEPLIGASVIIKSTNTGVITNIEGGFTIENLDVKSYILLISYIGYQNKDLTINVNNGVNYIGVIFTLWGKEKPISIQSILLKRCSIS